MDEESDILSPELRAALGSGDLILESKKGKKRGRSETLCSDVGKNVKEIEPRVNKKLQRKLDQLQVSNFYSF